MQRIQISDIEIINVSYSYNVVRVFDTAAFIVMQETKKHTNALDYFHTFYLFLLYVNTSVCWCLCVSVSVSESSFRNYFVTFHFFR